jgi:hypothetical protein
MQLTKAAAKQLDLERQLQEVLKKEAVKKAADKQKKMEEKSLAGDVPRRKKKGKRYDEEDAVTPKVPKESKANL